MMCPLIPRVTLLTAVSKEINSSTTSDVYLSIMTLLHRLTLWLLACALSPTNSPPIRLLLPRVSGLYYSHVRLTMSLSSAKQTNLLDLIKTVLQKLPARCWESHCWSPRWECSHDIFTQFHTPFVVALINLVSFRENCSRPWFSIAQCGR